MSDNHDKARPFARENARELTQDEIQAISGARPHHTNATGVGGDDPADPPIYV